MTLVLSQFQAAVKHSLDFPLPAPIKKAQVYHYIPGIIFQRYTCGAYMPYMCNESLRVLGSNESVQKRAALYERRGGCDC